VRVRTWLWRYGPAELAGTAGAVVAATAAGVCGVPAATAYAGAIGETLAFYAVVLVRDLRRCPGGRRGAMAALLVEFGPAEIADTVAVRPLAMYAGPLLLGNLTGGVLAGKVAADVVFYGLALAGYELHRAMTGRRDAIGVPAPPPSADR
jgi:hypothetical protein